LVAGHPISFGGVVGLAMVFSALFIKLRSDLAGGGGGKGGGGGRGGATAGGGGGGGGGGSGEPRSTQSPKG
jgi:hypothetical protein